MIAIIDYVVSLSNYEKQLLFMFRVHEKSTKLIASTFKIRNVKAARCCNREI